MDPHTATCIKAYEELKDDDLKTMIYSTAQWTKFSPTVLNAINQNKNNYSDKEALQQISTQLDISIPESIKSLFDANILHDQVIDIDKLEDEIIKFLKE